jgi:thiol-disulfide isomerase/thioredoxin
MQRRGLLKSGLFIGGAGVVGSIAALSGFARPIGSAPEFKGIEGWLNTAAPITVSGMRGMVALVNFWTYSCINCLRTIPYLKRWHDDYATRGLQIVGIHTPEFGFEHDRRNVEAYVREAGIPYPVGQDNNFRSWDAWSNEAWPGFYVLNLEGQIITRWYGEDNAHDMERTIRRLLGLTGTETVGLPGDDPDLSRIGSPELYFGSQHGTPQDRRQSPRSGQADYAFAQTSEAVLNQYQLDGAWSRDAETLVLRSPRGGVRMRFSAAKLHVVAGASQTAVLRVRVDGREMPAIEINRPMLYTLVNGDTYGEHVMELEAGTSGLTLYSATFG